MEQGDWDGTGRLGWNRAIVDGTGRLWMEQGDHKGRPYGVPPK